MRRLLAIGLSFLVAATMVAAGCAPASTPTTVPTSPPQATKPPAAASPAAQATKPPAAASPTAQAVAATPKPATVKVGYLGVAADAGIFIATEKGYFKEQGITSENIVIRSSPDFIPALSTGQLDVAGMVLSPALLTAADRGIDLRIVADKGGARPGFEQAYIALRKDLADSGTVKTAADLKGMKVAVPSLLSNGEQSVSLMLQEAKLTTDDVELIVLPFPEQMAAYANKAIAASFLVEPNTTVGARQGLIVKWKPMSGLYGGKVQATIIAYSPSMTGNKDLGQRWMVGYLKGVRDYMKALTTKQGWDEVVAILAKNTAVTDPELYKAMEMTYLDPNGALDGPSINLQNKFYVEKGAYTGAKTFAGIVDTSFADYATQKLGKQ